MQRKKEAKSQTGQTKQRSFYRVISSENLLPRFFDKDLPKDFKAVPTGMTGRKINFFYLYILCELYKKYLFHNEKSIKFAAWKIGFQNKQGVSRRWVEAGLLTAEDAKDAEEDKSGFDFWWVGLFVYRAGVVSR
jgi:hypothetical protein